MAFFSLRCSIMAGATDAPLEQRRINQLSVSVCLSVNGIIFET